MTPTQILSNEHRVIEVVLDCLERIVETANKEARLDRDAAEKAVEFIRNFADRCHHGKEEDHLFTTLVDKGMPKEGGPIGQMLIEHDLGRQYVAGMAGNIDAAADGDAGALEAYTSNALGYVQLLRSHIQKEDGILFPMADRFLSEEDQSRLLDIFGKVESEHMGEGTHEKYMQLAETLADKYGVSKDNLKDHSCGCGH